MCQSKTTLWSRGSKINPGKLVKDLLALPREGVNLRLHWRVEDPRSTLGDCGDIALARLIQFPSRRVAGSPLL